MKKLFLFFVSLCCSLSLFGNTLKEVSALLLRYCPETIRTIEGNKIYLSSDYIKISDGKIYIVTENNRICSLAKLKSNEKGIYFPVENQANTISWQEENIKVIPYMDWLRENALPWQCAKKDCHYWNPYYLTCCTACGTPRGYSEPWEGLEDDFNDDY